MEEEKKAKQKKRWKMLPYCLLGTMLLILGLFNLYGMEVKAYVNSSKLRVDGVLFVENGKLVATS